jgi:hypothetical protein
MDEIWSVERRGHWAVAARLVERNGTLRVAEVRVFPWEKENEAQATRAAWSGKAKSVPVRGLYAREIRKLIRLDDLVEAVRQDAKDPRSDLAGTVVPRFRGRPPKTDDVRLAQLVQDRAFAVGPRPVVDLARARGVSRKQVGKWLEKAKARGIADPRSGSRLTPYGVSLLPFVRLDVTDTLLFDIEETLTVTGQRHRPIVTVIRRRRKPAPRGRRRNDASRARSLLDGWLETGQI